MNLKSPHMSRFGGVVLPLCMGEHLWNSPPKMLHSHHMGPWYGTMLDLLQDSYCYNQTFHVTIHMVRSPVICHLMTFWNLTLSHEPYCLIWNTIKVSLMCPIHSIIGDIWYLRSLSFRSLSSVFEHCFILLCFIVAISRTRVMTEYPSIDLVLYSYTPNEEMDSWQIVYAHLTSFLKS